MKCLFGLLLSLLLMASLASAETYPVSGTASPDIDWVYSLTGPSFSFFDFQLRDSTILVSCDPSLPTVPCNFSASINGQCNLGFVLACGATVDGKTHGFMEGTLNLTGPELIPFPGQNGPILLPIRASGQFFAVDCSPDSVVDGVFVFTDCTKVRPAFGIDFTGTGTVSATTFNMDPFIGVREVRYNWTGTAESIAIPEPNTKLLLGAGLLTQSSFYAVA